MPATRLCLTLDRSPLEEPSGDPTPANQHRRHEPSSARSRPTPAACGGHTTRPTARSSAVFSWGPHRCQLLCHTRSRAGTGPTKSQHLRARRIEAVPTRLCLTLDPHGSTTATRFRGQDSRSDAATTRRPDGDTSRFATRVNNDATTVGRRLSLRSPGAANADTNPETGFAPTPSVTQLIHPTASPPLTAETAKRCHPCDPRSEAVSRICDRSQGWRIQPVSPVRHGRNLNSLTLVVGCCGSIRKGHKES